MCSWNNLPYEILLNIFQHLYQLSDIGACQLTCIDWSRPAQQRFYQKVSLIGSPSVRLFIDNLAISTNAPNKFVKTLHLGALSISKLNSNFFSDLAQLCPHLEHLSANWDYELWQNLIRERENGHLKILKSIHMPINERNLGNYVDTALTYRTTLEDLFLGAQQVMSHHSKVINMVQYNKLAERLNEFPCLMNLNVNIMTEKSLFALNSIIDSCPKLKKLSYTSYQPKDRRYAGNLSDSLKDLSLIVPHLYIKSFEGDNLLFTNDSVMYLMHKFPYLDRLTLNQLLKTPYSRIVTPTFDLSPIVMNAFFKFISKMHFLDVYTVIVNKFAADFISSFLKTASNTKNIIKIKYAHGGPFNNQAKVKIYKDLHDSSSESKISTLQPYNTTTTVSIEFQTNINQLNLPHFSIIKRCGKSLKELYLDTNTYGLTAANEDTKNRFLYVLMNQSLELIIKGCHFLETLTLRNMKFTRSDSANFTGVNSFVKTLVIENSNNIYSETMMQLARCFPSLKYLAFDGSRFYTNEDTSRIKDSQLIDIPDTKLENITFISSYCEADEDEEEEGTLLFLLLLNDCIGENYYIVYHNKPATRLSTYQEFKMAVETNSNRYIFHINCAYLKSFTLMPSDYQKAVKFVSPY